MFVYSTFMLIYLIINFLINLTFEFILCFITLIMKEIFDYLIIFSVMNFLCY
jgi:hypothetical protein